MRSGPQHSRGRGQGSPIPHGISGITARGEPVNWNPGEAGASLILFASPDCRPCAEILPPLNRLARDVSESLSIVVVVPGPQELAAMLVEKFRAPFLCLAEHGSGASSRYRVRVTPFAHVVKDGRVMAKGLCSNPRRLHDLLVAADLPAPSFLLEESNRPVPITRGVAP